MKKIFTIAWAFLALYATAFAQNVSHGPVTKITTGAAVNDITEDLNIPSGRKITIKAGGTFDATGGTVIGFSAGYSTLFGGGVPSNGSGNNGDVYYNTTTPFGFYKKAAGAWALQTTFADGPATTTALGLKVDKTTTVNGHALSGNVTVTPTDLSLVIGTNAEAWSANLDSWSALATSAKLNAANGNPTGVTTNAAGLVIAPASTSTVITVTAPDNFHTFSTAPTYTLSSNTPTAGSRFTSRHTNTGGSALLVTLPSVTVYSTNHGAVITTFWIGAGNTENLYWNYDSANSRFIVDGIPTPSYSAEFAQTAASTTDLWQYSLNQTVTGTTAITSFGSNAPAGTHVHLRFLDATPLTYNSTSLIIPGSASITAAVGDTCEAFALASGNWHIIRYVRRTGVALVTSDFWALALSDETTAITTGTAKITWRAPYAATITAVRAELNTVSSSGIPTVDIKKNGTSIFTTNLLTIDASEKTSVTAATAASITTTALADDDELTFDVTVAGTGAKGLKVKIYYTRP